MRSSLSAAGVAVAIVSPSLAGGTAEWVGPTIGNWSQATNWNPVGVPNGVAVTIAPPGGATVTLNASNLELPSVSIGTGSAIAHPSSVFCTIHGLDNDGAWTFSNATPFLALLLLGADVEFAGGGVVDLGANPQNRILGSGWTRVLTNSSTHTIRGAGIIGGGLTLHNLGTVEATSPTAYLALDLDPGENRNDALMVARDGARLRLVDSILDNAAGEIRAEGSGAVELHASTISGGMLSTAGSGVIRTGLQTSTLADVLSTGHVAVLSGTELRLTGAVVNGGLITTHGAPAFAIVRCTDNLIVDGDGVLELGGSATFDLLLGEGSATIVHGVGHTIRGGGAIGGGVDLALVNLGAVEATGTNQMVLALHGGVNDNDGTLAARDSALLRLVGGVYDNIHGGIEATGLGAVRLENTTILGGGLHTAGGGSIAAVGALPSTLAGTSNSGKIVVQTGATLHLSGTIVNDGQISTVGGGNVSTVACAADVTLDGAGEVLLNGFSSWNHLVGVGAVRTLTNGPDHTLRGGGFVGVNTNLNLVNEGEILADGSLEMRIDTIDSFVNQGVIRVAAPHGQLKIEPGGFVNRGDVIVEEGRQLLFNAVYVQEDGATRVDGGLILSVGSTMHLDGGTIGGHGGVSGSVVNMHGAVDPSLDADDPAQTLSISGNYVQGAAATLVVRLASGAGDRLSVGGAATLGGALAVDFAPGFVPTPGDEFTILTAASITGSFTCLESPSLASNALQVVVSPTSVKLVVAGTALDPADLNLDGAVDGVDLGLFLGSWGVGCGDACCPADLNHDDVVDAADLGLLLAEWG